MELTEAIAVFDKSAKHTRPNAQTEAWGVIRAALTPPPDAAVGAQGEDGDDSLDQMLDYVDACAEKLANKGCPIMGRTLKTIARRLAAPAAGKGVDAWMTDDGRVISARQKEVALRDGGASASSVAPYSTALTRQPATCECAECRRKRALTRNGSPFIMDPLPERDDSKPNSEQGLYRKFDVRRTDGSDEPGGKHHGCEYFVLDVKHDPLARAALAGYADAAEATHPQLAADLRERYTLTRQPVAGDGWRSVVYAALRSIRYNANNGSQDRPPHERLRLIGVEADRAIGCMEASYAAPAATPTDGGEG